MKIYSDGKSRVLNGAFPKHFRLLNGEKEVPFIRTGRESIRISGELPVGDLLVDEIIRQKVAQPAKLDAQSVAIINKQDFDRIDILNKKLAINQEKMGEQMNALAEHEATLANLETKNAGDIELLSGQTASAVQMLKGAIEDTEKKNVAVQKALNQAIKETGEDLSDSLVAHETAKNPHRITKATIGLEKVENIKPEDMPVSKAVKKELDKKADKKDIAEVEKKLTEKSDKIVKGIERMNMLGGVGGNELPVGGKKGQVLAKASNKTGDYEWSSAAGGVDTHNDLNGRSAADCHPISSITNLSTTLSTETTNRENADIGLQRQIDAITASSDVKDIVGTHAELESYDTSTLGNNDIIKVLQDETQNDQTTYYRWSTSTETFTLIGAEGPYYTKSEADLTFVPQTRTVNNKALSANITLDATDVGALPDTTPIPTANDYWTVGNSNDTTVQKTYSRKILSYKATSDQDNGFKMLGTEYVPSGSYSGYWLGRMLLGTDKHTFLLGTVINGQGNYMCGMGAHSWTDAEAQTGAAWDDIYIQPDGSKAVYLGGKQWKYQSGWMKVQNDGNATAAYRTFINTGTNTSPTWRTVLPNQASGSNSVLIKPNTSSTFSYTYGTSINGTVTANYGSSFGYNSSAAGNAVALGENATASGSYSIQLGHGTNSTANTMSVGLSNSLNVQLLDASGEIPDARIKTTIARVSQIPTQPSDIGAQPAGNYVTTDTTQDITAQKTFSASLKLKNSENAYGYLYPGQIEFMPLTTQTYGGFIDFHYAGSSADYTSRIIEDASGQLSYDGSERFTATNSTSSGVIATKGWVNDPTKSTNVVHRTGDESIAGAKTFSGAVSVPTQTYSDSDTSAASTAFVHNLENTQRKYCITHIPQDIKLGLSGGTLTLKTGSKLYIADGNFTPVTVTTDLTTTNTTDGKKMILATVNGSGIVDSLTCPSFSGFVSGSDTSGSAAGKSCYFNTSDKKIYVNVDNAWVERTNRCIPLGTVTVSGGAISSIDEVFNGFGYMGNTLFIFPGVQYLFPYGFNSDGTYKNQITTMTNVVYATRNSNLTNCILRFANSSALVQYNFREVDELPTSGNGGEMIYVKSENRFYIYSTSWGAADGWFIGPTFDKTNNGIENFNPPEIFRLASISDLKATNITAEDLYPVGSVYFGTQAVCPIAALIPNSTWTLKGTKILTDMASTAGVVGNGIAIGLTNGTDNAGMVNIATSSIGITGKTDYYGSSVSSSTVATGNYALGTIGLTTDSTKSGVVADLSSAATSLTLNVWERTA